MWIRQATELALLPLLLMLVWRSVQHTSSIWIQESMKVFQKTGASQSIKSNIPATIPSSTSQQDAQHTTENNTLPFTPQNSQDWLQRRTSQLIQLDQGLLINILTHGNTVVSAGDVVKLDLPYNASVKTSKDEKNDRFYKGMFLVKRLRHDFDFAIKKHKTHMTLVKDSLENTLDGPEDNFEPKPKNLLKSSGMSINKLQEFFYPNS